MGLSTLRLPTPRPGKPKTILLGVAASLCFLVIALSRPLVLESLASRLEGIRSGCPRSPSLAIVTSEESPSQTMMEENETVSAMTLKKYHHERGVGLFHAWTDSDLFIRTVTMERTRAFGGGETANDTSSRTLKIAFMFMIMDDLPFAPLWNKFFKGHEGLYNVYVHMWPLRPSAFQKSSGVFWGRVIPSQEGKRSTPGLIANSRRLLANALLDDPDNEWFAVISESCVPIHGFQHVYGKLASMNKSFLSATPEHHDIQNRYMARGEHAMEPEIEFSQFRIGSQFWVMRRRHAVMTVNDTRYWSKFDLPCLLNHRYCYPEEHYFPTLMNILDPGGINETVTFVDWSRQDPPGHPVLFNASEISVDFMRALKEKDQGKFLFARKFHRACLDPLLQIANTIFGEL